MPNLAAVGENARELARFDKAHARVFEVIDMRMQDFPRRLPHAAARQGVEAHEHDAIRRKARAGQRKQRVANGRRHPRIDAVRDDVVECAVRRRKRRQVFFDEGDVRQSQLGNHPASGIECARRQIAADELRRRQAHCHRNQIGAIVAAHFEHARLRDVGRMHAEERGDRGQAVRVGQQMR